jgi:hypothetical protein
MFWGGFVLMEKKAKIHGNGLNSNGFEFTESKYEIEIRRRYIRCASAGNDLPNVLNTGSRHYITPILQD